jgi:molybdate transport system substrate-binding protein
MPLHRHRPGRTARALAALVAGMLGAGCAAADGGGTSEGPGTPPELVVFAAASLAEAFEALGDAFAATDGGVPVVLNLAGSQTLAAQLVEGAPADVFAAADAVRMGVVAEAGLLAAPAEPFATNHLAIVVEPGNPRGITGPPDLARGDLVVVLPAEEVPAGRYARQVLAAAGVTVAPASLEPDVRAAVAKVALGEADATIAYASDVASADGRVDGVAIPDAVDVTATYPIAVLVDAPAGVDVAARFVAFVRSDAGRAILAAHGFGAP